MFNSWEVNKMIVSKEVGESGTPHLQGAITFKRVYRLAALKKLCPRAHWEPAKAKDCFNYCLKDGSEVVINKNNTKQGKRSDWEEVKSMIQEKRGRDEISEKFPNLVGTCYKGIEKLGEWIEDKRPVKNQKVIKEKEVIWIHGETGTGKTKYVYDNYDINDIWESASNLDWFDGYFGQKVVLIDDFRGDMCKFRWLLRLLDRYPLRVPIKGGFTVWNPEIIIITSCKAPNMVYNPEVFDNEEKVDQLIRRIKEIKHFQSS